MTDIEVHLPTILEDFSDIRSNSRVTDEDFAKGVRFALLMTSMTNKVKAYREVYGDSDNASRDASRLIRTKWVSDIIKRMHASNYLMFSDVRNRVISKMGEKALDDAEGTRNQVEAAKVFLEHTKMPENVTDIQVDITDEARESLQNLMDTLDGLVSLGKQVSPTGEVVDVELLK